MPKIVPGHEAGFPDAPFVRVAVRKGVVIPSKLLAIQHPVIGWLNPFAYKAVVSIQSFINRIDPIRGIAFAGLTVVYKMGIEAAEDAMLWFYDLMKNLAAPIPGTPGVTSEEGLSILGILGMTPTGILFGWLFPAAGVPAVDTEELRRSLDSWQAEIFQWFMAMTAAAVTIVLGPALISAVSPL